jgi:methionine--tRNA ligase beta chain
MEPATPTNTNTEEKLETKKPEVIQVANTCIPEPEALPKITIDDVHKVEITMGKILSAEKVEGSDKLLKLSVDFGEASPRQVISGIASAYPDASVLVGKSHPFVTNLAHRTIRGLESQAMIFAASHEGQIALMSPTVEVPPGTKLS